MSPAIGVGGEASPGAVMRADDDAERSDEEERRQPPADDDAKRSGEEEKWRSSLSPFYASHQSRWGRGQPGEQRHSRPRGQGTTASISGQPPEDPRRDGRRLLQVRPRVSRQSLLAL
jgi:hypothetical protein